MATQQTGVLTQPDNKQRQKGERESITAVLRDFGGVNLQSPRETIGDNEFAWLEGLIPIGPGNLSLVMGPGAPIVTLAESGAPTFTEQFDVAGTAFVFAVWANTGDAWVGPALTSVGWTKIASSKFTSGQTAAVQWNNLGLLIVDPVAGYYDWNITTASTLTNLSGQVYNPVLVPQAGLNPTTVPALTVADTGAGAGATVGISITCFTAAIAAPGTGYLAGDVLQFTGGALTTNPAAPLSDINKPTLLTVTAVGGGGTVTGVSFLSQGFYQTVPGNPVAVTGGAGTGATFTANWQFTTPFMITPGVGYVAPFLKIAGVASGLITFTSSGTVLGTAIAVYVNRVWIAIKRTVQFTDANSYSSFGNSGSAFTINDSYLVNNITALFAANNYLYIFGDTSVDVLSNVVVTAGTVSFSRINASASIGTGSQSNSIFAFSRAIAFANSNGFYVMSGATPQKISDKLDGLFPQIDFSAAGDKIYGVQVMIGNVLCAAFLFSFFDIFTQGGTERAMLAIQYKSRWFFVSQTYGGTQLFLNGVVSIPIAGVQNLFGWAGSTLYPLMSAAPTENFLLKTKLWDGGAPLDDKQSINVAIGAEFLGASLPGVVVNVDTELSSAITTLGMQFTVVQWINNAGRIVQWTNNVGQMVQWVLGLTGYQLLRASANNGGGKYIGITVTGTVNMTKLHLLALEYTNTRRW